MDYLDVVKVLEEELDELVCFMEYDDKKNLCEYTNKTFSKDVKKAATYLLENNYTESVVALIGYNQYKWIVSAYGLLYTATRFIPINPDMEKEKIINVLKELDVKLIIADDNNFKKIESMKITKTIAMDEFISGENKVDEFDLKSIISNITDDRVRLYMCSSGTTGKEKIVMLSTENILSPIKRVGVSEQGGFHMKFFWTLPFYHIGFLSFAEMILAGNVLCIGRSPKYYFRDVKAFEPNCVMSTPMFVSVIVKKIKSGIGLREIVGQNCKAICCGSAVLSSHVINTILEQGCVVDNHYGLTESCSMGTSNVYVPSKDNKLESVGKPVAGAKIMIKDGEILIGGSGIMLGYYNDEKLTSETLKDGWLYTGDLGYIDDEGYLYIVGRKKNIIITEGGENVIPEEMEKYFIEKDLIDEVCIYGLENTIVAEFYIGSKNTTKADVELAVKQYNKECPKYKVIKSVKFKDEEFEKTGTGKIKRF